MSTVQQNKNLTEESEGKSLVVHPIPWRSQYVACLTKLTSILNQGNKHSRKDKQRLNQWKPVHKTISKWYNPRVGNCQK